MAETTGVETTSAGIISSSSSSGVGGASDAGSFVGGGSGGLVGGGGSVSDVSDSDGSDGGGGGGSGGGGGGGPGLDLKAYHIDTEEIEDLAGDPKKEKIKKLAKNCSQGNKELCGWIMHKFGKMKDPNKKVYTITLGYECNTATKAKKSNKPIFGVIMRTEDSKKDDDKKKLKEIPVPKSCGDCVVPTVWRNNGDEKCFNMSEKIKPIHFCVKPCKEYLFQIFILSAQRYNNETLNGYENAQNYELLNRIGQIMKPKLFWAKILNTEKNNEFFKFNELSLNLSKININFPVFSDFLDLNKGSQEKVRNLLMTPEIIEFYVENPGLVTREVKQLLIALSDCYDVAKRYTGIFCKIAIDDEKITAYGGGDVDEACKKLLKEKKMGRFNEELNVDNGCGGGGGGKVFRKAYVEIQPETIEKTQEFLKDEKNKENFLNHLLEELQATLAQNTNANIDFLKKSIQEQLNLNNSLQKIKQNASSSGSSGSTEQPLLMFLNNCIKPYTCWIDSLLYFLYGTNSNSNYYMKKKFRQNFYLAFEYLTKGANTNNCLINIDNNWNVEFLQSLLPQQNEYSYIGMNDPVQVLENILETIRGTTLLENAPGKPQISQLIYPDHEPEYVVATQNNFYNLFYEKTVINDRMNNFLFQTCAGRRGKSSSKYKSLLLANITIPIYNGETSANINYNLQSFIVYKGGSHYVCYFKYNNDWWYYNDLVNNFTKENSLEEITTKINKTDYIILYNYGRVVQT